MITLMPPSGCTQYFIYSFKCSDQNHLPVITFKIPFCLLNSEKVQTREVGWEVESEVS